MHTSKLLLRAFQRGATQYLPSCPKLSEGQYHTDSHLFLFVLLGSGGQAESLTCKDQGYEESERSSDSIKISSKTLVRGDPGFQPTVFISLKVLINFTVKFAFLGHKVVETCGRTSSLP